MDGAVASVERIVVRHVSPQLFPMLTTGWPFARETGYGQKSPVAGQRLRGADDRG